MVKFKFKQTLKGGQVVDADWWVTTKVIALILGCIALGIGVTYPFI